MAMLLDIKDIGPEFAAVLWMEAFFRSFNNRKQVVGLRGVGDDALAKRIGRSRTGPFRKPAIRDRGQRSSSSLGYGHAISRNRRWLSVV